MTIGPAEKQKKRGFLLFRSYKVLIFLPNICNPEGFSGLLEILYSPHKSCLRNLLHRKCIEDTP